MALKPISVSQLNDYIGRVIGTDPLLGSVVVKGELSNTKYHSSGHVYFSIVDSFSRISCFLPYEYAQKLSFQLKDGTAVVITGSINVYKKNGSYSLYVKNIESEGSGSLAEAFEEMKNKLEKEGLFDNTHKKALPAFPNKVGVITSATGAAVRDILKILQTRNTLVDVTVFPVLVQGEHAAQDIARMLDYVNREQRDIDVLILGRGGGSAEDLWAFNEEILARSIYASEIPVISAVGHEIDYTISDFVADKRAETPTAAAQMAVPDLSDIHGKLSLLKDELTTALSNKIIYSILMIDGIHTGMYNNINNRISSLEHEVEKSMLVLQEKNPASIMKNGYSLVTEKTGRVIRKMDELTVGSSYNVTFCDGTAECKITKKGCDDIE